MNDPISAFCAALATSQLLSSVQLAIMARLGPLRSRAFECATAKQDIARVGITRQWLQAKLRTRSCRGQARHPGRQRRNSSDAPTSRMLPYRLVRVISKRRRCLNRRLYLASTRADLSDDRCHPATLSEADQSEARDHQCPSGRFRNSRHDVRIETDLPDALDTRSANG